MNEDEQYKAKQSHTENEEDQEPPLEDFLFTEEELEESEKRKKNRSFSAKLIALIIAAALLISGTGVWLEVFNLPSFIKKSNELSKIENIQNYKEAVVTIESERSKGTGFNISPHGYIITNYHVIENAGTLQIIFPHGEFFTATEIESHPELDIALLKIEGDELPYLELQEEKNWQVADPIYVIGNPLAYSQVVMEGEILQNTAPMHISAPIEKGNSGSPVINHNGKVISVVYAKTIPQIGADEDAAGLAVPVDQIIDVMNGR
ncbi:S1C family serine protease [Mesobacillus harenae]|uniref:S1C family serine protease n=1 Tax=Mesobacillus harenae TaxID=2213203 RepID=UPI0015808EBC|nr:serine protease [Mesobacillus harenae]